MNILKFTLIFSLLCFFSFQFQSCKKEDPIVDPCANITCLNGGTCVNGTCNCPPGYSGTLCEDYDPCATVTCLNGGTCANGICNCPPGYSGSDCSVVLTPVSVTINQVIITNYPATQSSGAGWDLTTGPDVFISINAGTSSNQNSFVSGFTYSNATSNSLTYSSGFPIILSNPNSSYCLGIWDADSPDPDDFMAGVYFTPNNYSSGFPPSISLTTASLSATFYITWNF